VRRRLSVRHIQDEDDTRRVFQRIPLVDLVIEIELRGLANIAEVRRDWSPQVSMSGIA
jgi:hypothetical protein